MHEKLTAIDGQEPRMAEDEDRRLLFDYAFEASPIGIALVDTLGRVVQANDSFARIVGHAREGLHQKPFADITHPDDLNNDLEQFAEVLDGRRNGYRLEKRYITADGRIVSTMLTVTAMRNGAGEVTRFISQIEDMTERKAAERQLAERAAQLELAMEAIRGGFWHMDVESLNFQTSGKLAEFVGGAEAGPLDLDGYIAHINPKDRAAASLTTLIRGEKDQSVAEYRLETQQGERWMRCDRRLLRDADGAPLRVVGVVIDLTDEYTRLEQLETSAETDALTALLNRRGFIKYLGTTDFSQGCGLLTIDLDGFKSINDSHGHAAGDGVLIETANRLVSATRHIGVACRMGGDEFLAIVHGSRETLEKAAGEIVNSLGRPIALADVTVTAMASVGGAWAADVPDDIEPFLKVADAQLYKAKNAGKNTWMIETFTRRW